MDALCELEYSTYKMFRILAIVFSLCCLHVGINCQSSIAQVLKPCALKDGKCQRDLWREAIQVLADNGDEELGILPLNPWYLNNITVQIPGIVDLTLIDGTGFGVKSCKVDNVRSELSKGRLNATIDLRCTLAIGGHYTVSAESSIIPGLVSDQLLRADGQGRVKLRNLNMKLLLDFDLIQNEAGEWVLYLKEGPIKYQKHFGGKVSFQADSIYLAGQDISSFVLTFLNNNWKLVMDTFGEAFFDKGIAIFTDILRKIFKGLPARLFLTENLDQYV